MPAKITSKGQITIPKWVRDLLDLKPGTRVEFIFDAGQIRLSAVKGSVAESMAGAFKAYAVKRNPLREQAMMESVRREVADAAATKGLPRRHKRTS